MSVYIFMSHSVSGNISTVSYLLQITKIATQMPKTTIAAVADKMLAMFSIGQEDTTVPLDPFVVEDVNSRSEDDE